MKYSEKLKDPRWQKRRYEIIKQRKSTCEMCGYIGSKLNIHHLRYDGEPWESKDEDLMLLCKECHRKKHRPEIKDRMFDKMHISTWLSGL
jgi:5-methylcytosine-specific restriction endonuclease McrA